LVNSFLNFSQPPCFIANHIFTGETVDGDSNDGYYITPPFIPICCEAKLAEDDRLRFWSKKERVQIPLSAPILRRLLGLMWLDHALCILFSTSWKLALHESFLHILRQYFIKGCLLSLITNIFPFSP